MKMKWKILLLGLLTAILVYVTLPSTNLIEKAYAENGKGSTIAGINVSGMKEKEMKKTLNDAIKKWKSKPIVITGGGSKLEIDSSTIQFDVEKTISDFTSLVDKPWYAFWKKENVVHIPLQVKPNEQLKNEIAQYTVWKTEETYNQLITNASYLKEDEIEAEVEDLSVYENERLSVVIEKIPNDVVGVNEIVEALNDFIVNPEEVFSFIDVIKEKIGNADNETLNFVASVLYSAVLETELEIVERHQQSSIPSYIDPGKEAQVNLATNEDLKFYNNSGHVAKINATIEGNKLKVEIYSDVKNKNVTVTIEEEVIKPRIITRYSRKLAIGQTRLIQNGKEGLRINVYRTITGNGETTEDRISRSYYPPKNRIVLQSTRQSSVLDNVNVTQPTPDYIDNVDLDGDGLPDVEDDQLKQPIDEEELPPGSYYDKGGNLITP